MTIEITSDVLDRFNRSFDVDPLTSCWIWTGDKTNGYGRMSIRCKYIRAHRLSLLIHTGSPVPEDLFVCHKCDVPLCVNPHHLFIGTVSDNNRDCATKRRTALGPKNGANIHRHRLRRGSRHGQSRLRESDVLEIIRDSRPQRLLANKYGVDQKTIHSIRAGKTWGWLTKIEVHQ